MRNLRSSRRPPLLDDDDILRGSVLLREAVVKGEEDFMVSSSSLPPDTQMRSPGASQVGVVVVLVLVCRAGGVVGRRRCAVLKMPLWPSRRNIATLRSMGPFLCHCLCHTECGSTKFVREPIRILLPGHPKNQSRSSLVVAMIPEQVDVKPHSSLA